jgi:hypothetical protein
VKRVESVKVLDVHITNDLSCSKHTKTVVKRERQNLFPLRRLKICGMGQHILKKLYSCTIKSILTGCITAWYGNYSASDRNSLQKVVLRPSTSLRPSFLPSRTYIIGVRGKPIK